MEVKALISMTMFVSFLLPPRLQKGTAETSATAGTPATAVTPATGIEPTTPMTMTE